MPSAYAHIQPMVFFSKWLKNNNNRAPMDVLNSPHTFAHQTDKPFFNWLHENPTYTKQFNHHMGGYRLGRPSWNDPDVYPVKQNLIAGFNSEQKDENGEELAMLVDIGGSYGHDIAKFHHMFPDAPGRLILQDLPVVLNDITDLDTKIERMPYDFNTEQPIKGARAYYLHHILHDYPDEKCVDIIQRVKQAMTPGYSKILVNEHVIPEMGADWEATYLDLYMMVLVSARERTESDWHNLLETRCGLRISKFWNPGNGVESVIECELVA
jgi:hypothetical protein